MVGLGGYYCLARARRGDTVLFLVVLVAVRRLAGFVTSLTLDSTQAITSDRFHSSLPFTS